MLRLSFKHGSGACRNFVVCSSQPLIARSVSMAAGPFTCQAEAEPLHRYCRGGYHPVHLGDTFQDGRYRVLSKLGWGSYSTLWAARDEANVAVKINVSETFSTDRELTTLQALRARTQERQPMPLTIQLLDEFQVVGPNGSHQCIVTELLGPSIRILLETREFTGSRLPAAWAKNISKQLLLAIEILHQSGIGHGDIHTSNLAIKNSRWDHLIEDELMASLHSPRTEEIVHKNNLQLPPELPKYLVWPQSLPFRVLPGSAPDIRLIDFGESFFEHNRPESIHTPLSLRAPEVIFEDDWEHRVDLWSAGCTIFELVTGQPPFGTIMLTKHILISEMIAEIGRLPDRWAVKWNGNPAGDAEQVTLEEWLLEVYHYDDRTPEFTDEDLRSLGKVLRTLMRFEPTARLPAGTVAQDDWFAGADGT